MSDGARTRTYRWDDPAAFREAVSRLSGLELMRGVADGTLPVPAISPTIGQRVTEVNEGEVTFTLTPEAFHANPLGSMHGGIAATMLDSALGCAIHTTLPAGQGFTTLTLEVKYLRAAGPESGTLTAKGRVVNRGRQVATAEGAITDAKGRLIATATTTCLIFPLQPPAA